MTPDPVRDLVDELRRRGWEIGAGDLVRVSRMARGSTGWTRGDLRLALRAALVKDAGARAEFDEAFELVMPEPAPVARVTAVPPPPRAFARRTIAAFVALAIAISGAAAGAIWLFTRPPPPPAPTAPEPVEQPTEAPRPARGQAPAEAVDALAPLETEPPPAPPPRERPSLALPIALAVAGGLAVALLMFAFGASLWVRRKRKRFYPGPYHHRLRVAREALAPLFSAEAIDDLASELGSAASIDEARIDAVRSVEATVRSGGVPTLVLEAGRRRGHHAVLLERTRESEPWQPIYRDLVARLGGEGVGIDLFEFDEDPAQPFAGPAAVPIAELSRTHDGVFVIGRSDALVRSPRARGSLEALEQVGAVWLEPSLRTIGAGIAVAERIELRSAAVPGWTQPSASPLDPLPPLVRLEPGSEAAARDLRERLGDAHAVLRGLSLLEEPSTDAARALALALEIDDPEGMLALLSLPWLAKRAWPERMRERLRSELDPEERARAAGALGTLLDADEPPRPSIAHLEWLAQRNELAEVPGAARELDHSPLHARAPVRVRARSVALALGTALIVPVIALAAFVRLTPDVHATKHDRALFDMHRGSLSWTPREEWSFDERRAVLVHEGPARDGALATVRLGEGRNDYAIEAVIRRLDTNDATAGFMIAARRRDGRAGGYRAGFHRPQPGGEEGRAWIIAGDPVPSPDLGSVPFEPGREWHKYRFDVRGSTLTLRIDNRVVVQAESTMHRQGDVVGVWAYGGAHIEVSSFVVFPLTAPAVPNVAGFWQGTVRGEGFDYPVSLVLRQYGERVTGTMLDRQDGLLARAEVRGNIRDGVLTLDKIYDRDVVLTSLASARFEYRGELDPVLARVRGRWTGGYVPPNDAGTFELSRPVPGRHPSSAHAAHLAADFYAQVEWGENDAWDLVMDRAERVQVDAGSGSTDEVHIAYRYRCVGGGCPEGSGGADQRVFTIDVSGEPSEWRVVEIGGVRSARFDGMPEELTEEQIAEVLQPALGLIALCGRARPIRIDPLVIDGSGEVREVTAVLGRSTRGSQCVEGIVRELRFPEFRATWMVTSYTIGAAQSSPRPLAELDLIVDAGLDDPIAALPDPDDDEAEVRGVLGWHGSQFRACLDDARVRNPEVHGRMVIELTMARGGRVATVAIAQNTTDHPPLADCVRRAVTAMQFPRDTPAGLRVSYPLEFNATGATDAPSFTRCDAHYARTPGPVAHLDNPYTEFDAVCRGVGFRSCLTFDGRTEDFEAFRRACPSASMYSVRRRDGSCCDEFAFQGYPARSGYYCCR